MPSTKRKYGEERYYKNTRTRASFARASRSYRPRPETKYCDNIWQGNFTTGGLINVIGTIAEGSDVINRVGRKVTAKNLQLTVNTAGGGSTNGVEQCRVLILQCIGKNTGNVTDYISTYENRADPSRSRVLFDELLMLTNDNNNNYHCNRSIRIKNSHNVIKWTSALAADDCDNQIILITMCGAAGAVQPQYTVSTRLWFNDSQ